MCAKAMEDADDYVIQNLANKSLVWCVRSPIKIRSHEERQRVRRWDSLSEAMPLENTVKGEEL